MRPSLHINFQVSSVWELTKFIPILLLISTTNMVLMAQTYQSDLVQLSNYTYSEDRAEVGLIFLNGQAVKQAKLSGANAHVFKVSQGNKLSILPAYKTGNKNYDLVISVKTREGIFSDTLKVISDRFLKNKVIAHRGAWKKTVAPENSIASLKHAIDLGCGASEFDVHMTADSVLVINHDPVIQGMQIETSTARELDSVKLSNGESIPLLAKYLETGISQNKTKLILEIKPSAISKERGIATTRKVLELVQKLKAQAWIDYISFDYDICKELIKSDPFARVAYLNGDRNPKELKADKLWGYDYHYNVLKKNESWLKEAREQGLTTNAWTVNDKKTMQWMLDRKIDFITTNEPEMLLDLLKDQAIGAK